MSTRVPGGLEIGDSYEDALRIVLEIPRLEVEAARATRIVRCLVRPSHHVEFSVSVVECGDSASLTVRVPSRSVWGFYNSRHGQAQGDPLQGWVKPTVSIERVRMTADALAAWRVAVDALEDASFDPRPEPGLVLDGVTVDIQMWRPEDARSIVLRLGQVPSTDPLMRLMRVTLDAAWDLAEWRQSVTGLQGVRASVWGDAE